MATLRKPPRLDTIPREIRQHIFHLLLCSIPREHLFELNTCAPIRALAGTYSMPILDDLHSVVSRFPIGCHGQREVFQDSVLGLIGLHESFEDEFPQTVEDQEFEYVLREMDHKQTDYELVGILLNLGLWMGVSSGLLAGRDVRINMIWVPDKLRFDMRTRHIAKFEAYATSVASWRRWDDDLVACCYGLRHLLKAVDLVFGARREPLAAHMLTCQICYQSYLHPRHYFGPLCVRFGELYPAFEVSRRVGTAMQTVKRKLTSGSHGDTGPNKRPALS